MSEKHTDPGAGPTGKEAEKAAQAAADAQAKQAKAEAEAAAKQAARRAEEEEEKAHEADREEHAADKETGETPSEHKEREEKAKEPEADEPEADEAEEEVEVVEDEYVVKAKPELDDALQQALRVRSQKKAKQPNWRRQEWFRYKKLGGRKAPWRAPRGMHSKMRMHLKYRPNVVSIGFRGPVAARGRHPSGFEDVLVHRPEDLEGLDPKTQAARIGGTVGGRKAERIQTEADKLGIRILNRRS